MISLLRERFEHISILLPYVAYSAATILSLGADEILMHKYANLGPVDPQMTVTHKNANGASEKLQFSSEDIMNFIDFLKTDIGISNQQYLVSVIQPLINQVGSIPIGVTKRSQRLSLSLSERMLSSHINKKKKVRNIAKALNSSYFHHGYAVGRKEALEIGLPIVKPSEKLENILWNIWLDYEKEMKCNAEFNVLKEIMNDPNSASIVNTIPILNIPADLPEAQKQLIYQSVTNTIGNTKQNALKLSNVISCIESLQHSFAFYNDIVIHYWRDPKMNLLFNATQTGSG